MGRFRFMLALGALGQSLVLGGCGIGGSAYDPVAPDVAATVNMTQALSFMPGKLAIRKGDLVEWRNVSPFSHDVVFDPDEEEGVVLPEGVEPFESGRIPPGDIFRRRFTVPGHYRYVSGRHDEEAMAGEIEVLP